MSANEIIENQSEIPIVESKYPYLLSDWQTIRSYLDHVCLKDQKHSKDRINSIYFDTRNRKHLAEKVDSDYLKTKVRLRWYGWIEDLNPEDTVHAYLEVKTKEGIHRYKARKPLEVKARMLHSAAESIDELTQLAVCAREFGWVPYGQLFPAIAIHYDRVRYVDPTSFTRLALDSRITYNCINTVLWAHTKPRQLKEGVLEVKSQNGVLPRMLWPIRERLSMRDAFSKYEECWQSYTNPLSLHYHQLRRVYFN